MSGERAFEISGKLEENEKLREVLKRLNQKLISSDIGPSELRSIRVEIRRYQSALTRSLKALFSTGSRVLIAMDHCGLLSLSEAHPFFITATVGHVCNEPGLLSRVGLLAHLSTIHS